MFCELFGYSKQAYYKQQKHHHLSGNNKQQVKTLVLDLRRRVHRHGRRVPVQRAAGLSGVVAARKWRPGKDSGELRGCKRVPTCVLSSRKKYFTWGGKPLHWNLRGNVIFELVLSFTVTV